MLFIIMLVCVILLKDCIYLYIYYVPATKLCNREQFSLKMLRRTIKVFYIYKRKRAAWEVVQNRVNVCGVAYRKRAAWEVVQNRVNTCGVAYRKRAAWEVVQNRVNACGVALFIIIMYICLYA